MTLGFSATQLGIDMASLNKGAVSNPENTEQQLLQLYSLDANEFAKSNMATPALLHLLAGNKSWLVRKSVAGNRHTSLNTLEELAGNDPSIHWIIASHSNASPKLLAKIADFKDKVAAQCVAEHYKTSVPTLRMLGNMQEKEWSSVRATVAKHLQTPKDVLVQLLGDEDYYVRWAAAQNLHTPPEEISRVRSNLYPSNA